MSGGIDFGDLDRVSHPDVKERTFAAWVYLDTLSATARTIVAPFADTGGVKVSLNTLHRLTLYSNRHNVFPGAWVGVTTTLTTGAWYSLVVGYRHTQVANDPVMYVNGVAQEIVEVYTPAGALNVELGTHVVVGNIKTTTQDYTEPFVGKLYDVRIYANKILTADEAVTLYNGGTPDPSLVTDGLVFQCGAVRTDEASNYIDVAMDSSYYILENMFKARGRIHGTVTARAAP